MTRGGARYNYGSITGRGLGTVTNSLAAIRWAVFEREMLTMDELIGHLRRQLQGRRVAAPGTAQPRPPSTATTTPRRTSWRGG